MDRLPGHPEQGPDLGPAEPGMACPAYRHVLAPGQLALRLGDRRQLAQDATVVVPSHLRPHGCQHMLTPMLLCEPFRVPTVRAWSGTVSWAASSTPSSRSR